MTLRELARNISVADPQGYHFSVTNARYAVTIISFVSVNHRTEILCNVIVNVKKALLIKTNKL